MSVTFDVDAEKVQRITVREGSVDVDFVRDARRLAPKRRKRMRHAAESGG